MVVNPSSVNPAPRTYGIDFRPQQVLKTNLCRNREENRPEFPREHLCYDVSSSLDRITG
jgi:hypothetical protein